MFKLKKKVVFLNEENRMKYISDKNISYLNYKSSKNLNFLLNERFDWMNKFIEKDHKGIEVGSGIGFAKNYIKNTNFKITDLSNASHLDYKNINAENTGFNDNSFNCFKCSSSYSYQSGSLRNAPNRK